MRSAIPMFIIPTLCILLHTVAANIVHIKNKSNEGSYQINLKNYEAEEALHKRFSALKSKCSRVTDRYVIYCEGLSNNEMISLVQRSDLIDLMEGISNRKVTLTEKTSLSSRKGKRSAGTVPWNLDRINQFDGVLDKSFRDEANVNVYILGTGIRIDHSDFGNRASVGYTAFGADSDDCEGSGTMLASLVGGKSMGIARDAKLIGVKVIDCSGNTNIAKVIKGINWIKDEIQKDESVRSVVLVGFTEDRVEADINRALVDLSEAAEGILVVAGAGKRSDYDACATTPASAQGDTALKGVVTIGATDADDVIVSNIGECVDLFAPGHAIPAAGMSDSVEISTCTGSLCAAALAAGVVARSLRENSKIDIEVQKSMLINGATITSKIGLPDDDHNYDLKLLKAQTPHKILYYICGYSRDEEPPMCESHTDNCNNSVISTFDGNNVPLYRQEHKKCSFIVFESSNGVKVTGSYHDCKLATYTVKWAGDNILVKPGPSIDIVNKNIIQSRYDIDYESDSVRISHHVDSDSAVDEPLVVVSLMKDGEEEIKITYDGTSRLRITLLKYDNYNGDTSGLCGFYDGIGTNDYKLKDGKQLSTYDSTYHKSWHTRQDCDTCQDCDEQCDDSACQAVAQSFCNDKFAEASKECLNGVNVYKQKKACVEEVAQCCCQTKDRQTPTIDMINKQCCQDSFFGNFERNREHCDFCTDHWCEKEKTHEHCKDDSGGKMEYDYSERVTYEPESCCYYLPAHDHQDCLAPRNDVLMWDKGAPVCAEKTCPPPHIPNNNTLISPVKEAYGCEETVTITCNECHKIDPSPQVIKCQPDGGANSNDAGWTEPIHPCNKIMCEEPSLPGVREDKGLSYPLSWVRDPIPYTTECGDRVTFACDICYEMHGEAEAECMEDGKWTDSPRCMLQYCSLTAPTRPLQIINDRTRACNDTIEYRCSPNDDTPAECYDLEGSASRQCRVDDDGSLGWDPVEPACKIRHCPELTTDYLAGKGHYEFKSSWSNQYEQIYLTATGSNGPTECGADIHTVCEECSFLCGPEYRTCLATTEWSGERPRCAKRLCVPPVNDPTSSHATYSPQEKTYDCGETVEFECENDCYEYNDGTEVHTCQPDTTMSSDPKDDSTKWDGNSYTCKIKQCPEVVVPEHGYISITETTCGTVVSFSCDICYELDEKITIECQSDKSWSGNPPSCIKKECPQPISPVHGGVSVPDSVQCDKEIQYSCEKCYELKGEPASVCQDNKQWSTPAPTCQIWECPKRGNPENGDISNENYKLCGDDITYTCDHCYTLDGKNKSHCGQGGVWDNEPPVCTRNICVRPDIPPHTIIEPNKESYLCGEYFEVKCGPCHEPCNELEVSTIYCNPDGWSDEIVPCEEKKCPNPGPLQVINSTMDFGLSWKAPSSSILGANLDDKSDTECGGKCTYSCNECYNLVGDNPISCESDKTWTKKPSCELKTCEGPKDTTDFLTLISHGGTTVPKQRYSCGEGIEYSCDKCYTLEGARKRRCTPVSGQEKAVWKPSKAPSCQINSCDAPDITDELLEHDGAYTCGSVITFKCPDCFKLVGASSAKCLHGETNDSPLTWDKPAPTCVPVCCPALKLTMSEDPTYDVPVMSFTYQNQGDEEQVQYCSKDHVCQIVDAKCDQCYEYYNRVEEKFYDVAPSRECKYPENDENEGYWTNEDKVCQRKQCKPRSTDKSQHIKYKEEDMAQMINCNDPVEFECKACHETVEEVKHTCTTHKTWSHPIPTCTLKECGDLPAIEHCKFTDGNLTCGYKRDLECESCWYTGKCEENEKKNTQARCTDSKDWEWLIEEPEIKMKRCDEPPEVAHATFKTNANNDQYMCGNVVKYECDECFKFEQNRHCNCATVKCEGKNEQDCTKGAWVGTFPTCLPMECPIPPVPDNARVKQQNYTCGAMVEFECNDGYELVDGDLVRTCTTSESWTGKEPVCQIRNCTGLDAPEDGSKSTPDHHYGTVVQFYCDDCYEFPAKMTDPDILSKISSYPRYHILKCEASGNWNGSVPICRARYCGNPGRPANTELLYHNFTCGAQVRYACNQGYYKSDGNEVLTCGTDSQWDGTPMECEEKKCPKPAGTSDGKFLPANLEEYHYKTVVSYDCNVCYETKEVVDLTCEDKRDNTNTMYNLTHDMNNEIAEWDNAAPTCSRKKCRALKKPAHGVIKVDGSGTEDNDCGRLISVECKTGYRVNTAHQKILCRSNGQWTNTLPTCQLTCCSRPAKPDNGTVVINGNDGKSCYQSSATYECDSCHKLVGTAHQTCTESGTWSGVQPECNLIRCSERHYIKDGVQKDIGIASSCGTVRKFTCNSGYEMSGKDEIRCKSNGEWSGPAPTCGAKKCPKDFVTIEHGTAKLYDEFDNLVDASTIDRFKVWDQVQFECDGDYAMVGEFEDVFCDEDGSWSNPIPECSKMTCPAPPHIDNGEMSYTNLKEGGTVSYSCDNCYQLKGYERATCRDESWSPDSVPQCVEQVCYPPAIEDNSKIVDFDEDKDTYSCGESVKYACETGYVLHGSQVITCSDDRTWSAKAPVCADITCDTVNAPDNGHMSYDNTSKTIIYTCDRGYALHGDEIVLCVKGQWQGVHGSCSKEVCGDPGTPVFGTRKGERFEYEDTVIFHCKTGYQIRGNTQIECQYDGTWDYDTPECVCDECPRLTEPENGFITTALSNSYNSVVEYACDAGYEVLGENTRTCLASGKWSSYQPVCHPINCTEHAGVPQLATITVNEGHQFGDKQQIKCEGQKSYWTRECLADGTWSLAGELPSTCECRMIKKRVKTEERIPSAQQCFLGTCTTTKWRIETIWVEKTVQVC